MTTGPRRGLRPRLPGLRGRAHGPLARAAARSGATASASRSGSAAAPARRSRRGSCSRLALVPMRGPRRARRVPRLGADRTRTTSSCRPMPTTTSSRSSRSASSPPSSRRCCSAPTGATACSRSTRRGRSRRPTTSRSRWVGVLHRRRDVPRCSPRRSSSPGTLLDAARTRHVDPGRQLGRRAALPCSRPVVVAVVLTTLGAARRVVHDPARVRVDRRCSPCSSSAARSAASPTSDFSGGVADAVTLASLPQALTDAVHWIFGDELAPSRVRRRRRALAARAHRPCSRPGSCAGRADGARVSGDAGPTIVVDGLSQLVLGGRGGQRRLARCRARA